MVTIINKPIGHKLDDSTLSGDVTNSGGDVLITTSSSHGLSDGDYVYVQSNIGSYSGFMYVDSVAYNSFKIKESEDGDYIQYKQNAEVEYQVSILNHGVQCVHLPIVYELESSIYPNNTEEESYSPNTVDSFSDNNGRVQIELDKALSDPTRYSKIELVGSGVLSGAYQIIQVLQPWSVVIDLAYDAGYDFSGYIVVKYYDNYAINVNVYSGLQPGHRWEDEKPVELIATLRLVPDENNRVLFSINEYLRSKIKTVNEIDIDTQPNNLNFLTEFYIGVFESYDTSDGDEITITETSETIDDFVGQAINAKNEFKNLYSGHLSEYIGEEDHPAMWLTDFETPIAVVGYFFDASFYNDINNVDLVVSIFKRSGESVVEETEAIENPGKGIIRLEIEPEVGYDQYCIEVSTEGSPETTQAIILPDLSGWESANIDPDLEDWVEGASPQVTLPYGDDPFFHNSASEYLYVDYPFIPGTEYTISISLSVFPGAGGGTPPSVTGRVSILDGSFNIIYQGNNSSSISTVTFTATGSTTRIGFKGGRSGGTRTSDASVTVQETSGSITIPAVLSQTITEQLCITILEECDSTLIGDLRELESGNFRLLE